MGCYEIGRGEFDIGDTIDRKEFQISKDFTTPSIETAQNTDDSKRLVAAQARLYSDAKSLFFARIFLVLLLAIAAIVAANIWTGSRSLVGGAGGIALLLLSLVVESVEKRVRNVAVATQEQFDTAVFQLPWNTLLASRPSRAAVARAASRYRGNREANWYDPTGRVERPFDVLVCQAANLGWGASMHRIWATLVFTAATASAVGLAAAWYLLQLPFDQALTGLLIPALAPAKEAISLGKSNIESATEKEQAEAKLNTLWERGMLDQSFKPSADEVRSIQDKILITRQANSYVPDWLDTIFHRRNEAAMRASISDRVEQAHRCGRARD